MKKIFTLWACIGTLFISASFAQKPAHRTCGTMAALAALEKKDPGLKARRAALELTMAGPTKAAGAKIQGQATNIIPVVVHVVYKTSAENVSDAAIKAQIDVLNKDFRRLNADSVNTPSGFRSNAGDTGIEFALATVDPNGAPTTGITRTSTTKTTFSADTDDVKANATGGKSPWPASDYMNIWLCNLGGGVLGYAQFPGGPASSDGIVLLYSTLPGGSSAPYNLGRTATHEVGHFLNLYHIWGDEPTCAQDDLVADTPLQKEENYGCPTYPLISGAGASCTAASPGAMFMNYMDYTDDNCMNMFSKGQRTRMQAVLSGPRASLVTSGQTRTFVANFNASATTIPAGGSINFTSTATGAPTGYSWTFQGAATSSSTLQHPTGITYNTPGNYSVTLTVSKPTASLTNTRTITSYITVTAAPTNSAPTNISLSATAVNENVAANTVIGTLATTDANAGNTFSYLLVPGTGSTDNAAFNISGNSLRINSSPDFETKSSYSIRVRSTDQGGLFFEKSFTITVTDLAESVPTITTLNSLAPSYFQGSPIKVSFTKTGIFNAGNTFQVQLSNASGSFATPTVLPANSVSSSYLSATIPVSTPAGTGYRVRIVSTSPAITGTDNGANITIAGPTIITLNTNLAPVQRPGSSIKVYYTRTGLFGSGNTFQLQLSDGSGSFANPTTLTLTRLSSRYLSAAIPMNTPTGTGYRVRVVSTNPAVNGTDNGTNLSITNNSQPIAITSVASGNWHTASTWSCNCVPSATQDVTLSTNNTVTISANAEARGLTINANGSLLVQSPGNLAVKGNYVNNGNYSATGSNLTFNGTAAQTMSGSGTSAFNDLTIQNTNGVNITGGTYSLKRALQVNAGTLAKQAGTFTLVSDAATTAYIAPVASGSDITGNFIIQRYISTRNANWADLASPVTGSTLADWDNEIIMSGVGGPDGTACCPAFNSVYTYTETNDTWTPVTNAAGHNFVPGQGFELYLATTQTTFNAGVLDSRGKPFVGSLNIPVSYTPSNPSSPGFNLIGNPYAAPIAWDNLTKSNIGNTYYVFDAATGTYVSYGAGTIIPAHQGFWVAATGANASITFTESAKSTSTSSTFLRNVITETFSLSISGDQNTYSHKIKLGLNEDTGFLTDASYLKSRTATAPAITFKVGNKELVQHSADTKQQEYILPVNVYAGVTGKYTISADGLGAASEYATVVLEDRFTGKALDLKVNENYSFEVSAGQHNDRFYLRLSKTSGALNNLAGALTVIPNPAQADQIVTLNLAEALTGAGVVYVYDMLGKQVMQQSIADNQKERVLSLKGLKTGLYQVKVVSGNQTNSAKLIVQ